MEATTRDAITVTLGGDELALVRTALRLLESTLGREEADELAAVQALLARLPEADGPKATAETTAGA
jgi:hypothetical protein